MLQFVAFKMHMVEKTKHNRTATTERANHMSIINGILILIGMLISIIVIVPL